MYDWVDGHHRVYSTLLIVLKVFPSLARIVPLYFVVNAFLDGRRKSFQTTDQDASILFLFF